MAHDEVGEPVLLRRDGRVAQRRRGLCDHKGARTRSTLAQTPPYEGCMYGASMFAARMPAANREADGFAAIKQPIFILVSVEGPISP